MTDYLDQLFKLEDVIPNLKGYTTGYLLTTSSQVVYFRDTGLSIGSSVDGQLDIVSDTKVLITSLQTHIGLTGTPIVLTEGTPTFALYATNAGTDGAVSAEPFFVSSTLTGVGQVGGRARFFMTTNVALGGWSNALKGEVTYGASGRTNGLGSSILAEMTLSAGTTQGNYALFEGELNVPSGASLGTKTALAYLSVNGTGVATFDTGGYILNLQGLSVASGKVFQVNTAAAASHALRILIGSTDYYFMLTNTAA